MSFERGDFNSLDLEACRISYKKYVFNSLDWKLQNQIFSSFQCVADSYVWSMSDEGCLALPAFLLNLMMQQLAKNFKKTCKVKEELCT